MLITAQEVHATASSRHKVEFGAQLLLLLLLPDSASYTVQAGATVIYNAPEALHLTRQDNSLLVRQVKRARLVWQLANTASLLLMQLLPLLRATAAAAAGSHSLLCPLLRPTCPAVVHRSGACVAHSERCRGGSTALFTCTASSCSHHTPFLVNQHRLDFVTVAAGSWYGIMQ